jgi:hypothetical protein
MRTEGGNDSLSGGAGDDGLSGGNGSDSYDGGAGFDWLDFASDNGPVRGAYASAATGEVIDGFGNAESFVVGGIEQFIGGALADEFFGTPSGQATPDGFAYFFRMQGCAGNDTLAGDGQLLVTADYSGDSDANGDGDGVLVNLALGFATDGWGNQDTLANINSARGSAFADTIIGNDAANILQNSAGQDEYDGAGGDDLLATTDTPGMVVDLADGLVLDDGFGNRELITGIEGVLGSLISADQLFGDAGANRLDGRATTWSMGAATTTGSTGAPATTRSLARPVRIRSTAAMATTTSPPAAATTRSSAAPAWTG